MAIFSVRRRSFGAQLPTIVAVASLLWALPVAAQTTASDNTPTLASAPAVPNVRAQGTSLDDLVEQAWAHVGLAPAFANASVRAGAWADATERARGGTSLQGGVGVMTMGAGMAPAPMVNVGVSQDIAKRGAQRLRADAIRYEHAALDAESDAARRRLRREVETLLASVHYLNAQRATLDEALDLNTRLERMIEARLPYDLSLESALLFAAQVRVTLQRERAAIDATSRQLSDQARSLGLADGDLLLAPAALWFLAETDRTASSAPPANVGAIAVPALDADAHRRAQAIAQARAAAQEATPTWSVGGGYGYSAMMAGHDDAVPSHSLMIDVGVRFPSSTAARAQRDYQRDEAERGAAIEADTRRSLQLEREALGHELARLDADLALLREQSTRVQADEERALERALLRGGVDLIGALTVWQAALDLRKAEDATENERALTRIAAHELDAAPSGGGPQ